MSKCPMSLSAWYREPFFWVIAVAVVSDFAIIIPVGGWLVGVLFLGIPSLFLGLMALLMVMNEREWLPYSLTPLILIAVIAALLSFAVTQWR